MGGGHAVRWEEALLEDRTFTLPGLERGNLCQIPSTVLGWNGGAMFSCSDGPSTVAPGLVRGQVTNVPSAEGSEGGQTCTDGTDGLLPPPEVLGMFLPHISIFSYDEDT